ncbi:MAG: ATPase, T2SS/T4P/T4SS family [Acidimicrobiales bacterium]
MTMTAPQTNDDLVGRIRSSIAAELFRQTQQAEATSGRRLQRSDEELLARDLLNRHFDELASAAIDSGREPLDDRTETEVGQAVLARLFQLGRLQPLLDDTQIMNINANSFDRVFIEYADGSKVQGPPIAGSDEELVEMIREIARRYGLSEREFNMAHPKLHMQLPDGSRLTAVNWLSGQPSLSIRRHRFMRVDMAKLVELGAVDHALASFLSAAVRARKRIIIAGATGAGKTTMLRALASEIPPDERIVTVETEFELGLDRFPDLHPDCVALETRAANVEGVGEFTLADLVKLSLRMDPGRVIVGEVLGAEVIPMLNAMSQGNDGSLCTIHAHSSGEVFNKIALYAMQSPERLDLVTANHLAAGAIDLVVFISKNDAGRYVSSVRQVVEAIDRQVVTNELFRPGPDGRAVTGDPLPHDLAAELALHGYRAERGSDWGRQ